MVKPSCFSSLTFWLSYVGFVLFWVFVLMRFDPLDITGTAFFLCAITFPVPFLLLGYYAPLVPFSMLYALLALLLSYFMFFYGLPAIGDFVDPRDDIQATEEQKGASE